MTVMKRYHPIFLILLFALSIPSVFAELPSKTANELLGYPPDARLLIIHADDLGLAHTVNRASLEALDSKAITTGSIMVPCPCGL